MSQTAQPQPESSSAAVNALLTLRDPLRPTRTLPRLLRRLVPDPLKSFEELERFTHADLAAMSPAERQWEAHRVRVAAALVDDDACVPSWLLDRLARLAS